MFVRSTLLILLVTSGFGGSFGCARTHSSAGSLAMPEPATTRPDDDMAGGDYAVDEAEEISVERASRGRSARFSWRNAKSEARGRPSTEMASPAPAPPEPAGAAGGALGRQEPPTDTAVLDTSHRAEPGDGAPGKAEPAVEAPEHDAHGRQIIYTATLSVSVFNLEEAMKKAEALPESRGGYIHSMSSGHLVMRIPSRHLRDAMEEVAGLGIVEQRSLQAQDVTAEYVDIESRIRVLQETQKQMIALLAKARTVDEALEVRKALDQITMELEVLEGRMRQLRNMISFSTLTVSLVERGPHVPVPSSKDPFPWVNDLGVESTEWE